MPDLLKLPFRAADLATRPARFVIGRLLDLRHSDDDEQPAASPARQPPPPVDEVPRPAPKKRAPAKNGAPSVKAARRATRHEPTKGEAAALRQQQREEEWGDDSGPGANVVIDPAVTKLVEP